jgi:cytochrome b pre-mRNA-processing protein 3
MLATICAILIVRLEAGSEKGEAASAALTERFIEAMDAEHRQLGLNDPGLGRRIRKLVGSLERRVDSWRDAVHGETGWDDVIVSSVYRDEPPEDEALAHAHRSLRAFWDRLSDCPEERLVKAQFR